MCHCQTPKARVLLLKFTGVTRDRKKARNPKPLTEAEVRSLYSSLKKENLKCLVDLVSRLILEAQTRSCPEPYREFLSEIARSSPACGLLQLGSESERIVDILHKVASNTIDIQDSANHDQLAVLQVNVPVLSDFICRCPKTSTNKLSHDVCATIRHIVQKATVPLSHDPHSPDSYTQPVDNHLSFFPALPEIRGSARYQADVHTHSHQEDD